MRPRTVEDLRSKLKSEKPIIIDPCIVPKNPSTCTCKPPLCASCQIARAKRRPTEVSTTVTHQESLVTLSNLEPGSRVSIDQYESAVRGRLASTKGRESFGQKYAGGTIFCDHASGYIQCVHQVSLVRSADTLTSKRALNVPLNHAASRYRLTLAIRAFSYPRNSWILSRRLNKN